MGLLEVLKNKKVHYLYHANTVVTAITFLENNGLYSRQAVEDKGLFQTPQVSDETDKFFGVYNDIFFDSCDIHARASKVNSYGPVLFVYHVDLLSNYLAHVAITKSNPLYWKAATTENEKYFQNIEEIMQDFNYGTFAQHITIRNIGYIGFSFLSKIIFDSYEVEKLNQRQYNIWKNAYNKLNIFCISKFICKIAHSF